MQFIKNGPDTPEELLEAQEEGWVVFFCGAEISRPAGLPGFDGLVDKIYDALGVEPSCLGFDDVTAPRRHRCAKVGLQ